ncbi:MAG TPA: IS701 family transposase [Anaerolineales bacterium]|nr:IS701 family transposase [Anaerolineales bacterium]
MKKITQRKPRTRPVGQPPASGQRPKLVTRQDGRHAVNELIGYHRQFEQFFRRQEQSDWSWFYLCAQLSNLERKTIEPMVLLLLGAHPHAVRNLQRFMSESSWDCRPPMIHLQALVAKWLGERDAVVIVDGSGFPKQGKHSIGVAHQYCGHLGKIANCQQGVFLAYASRQGYSFLDERLYLPQEWFAADHRQKRQACGLPAAVKFQTEAELALEMLQELNERGVVPFQWVAYDESYGKNPAFLAATAALHKWYLAEVPSDTRVWLCTPRIEEPGQGAMGRPRLHRRVRRTAPAPEEVRALILRLPRTAWHRHWIQAGSKGPLLAEFAVLRVTPIQDRLPGFRQWLICRRSLGAHAEVKFYLSNAPSHCTTQELVRVSGLRWPIETTLQEAKGEVGMDHYEVRTWLGWLIICSRLSWHISSSSVYGSCSKKTASAHQLTGSADGGRDPYG